MATEPKTLSEALLLIRQQYPEHFRSGDLLAVFKDVAPKLKKELHLVECFVKAKGPDKLNANPGARQTVVRTLCDDYYINEEMALHICRAYAHALNGRLYVPQNESNPGGKPGGNPYGGTSGGGKPGGNPYGGTSGGGKPGGNPNDPPPAKKKAGKGMLLLIVLVMMAAYGVTYGLSISAGLATPAANAWIVTAIVGVIIRLVTWKKYR